MTATSLTSVVRTLKIRARELWCDWFHRGDHIRLNLYKQGTYEIIGEAIFCKRCVKGG